MKNKLQEIFVEDPPIYGFNLVVLVGDKHLVYNQLIKNKVKESEASDVLNNDYAGIFINSDDSGVSNQIIVLRNNSIYDLIHEIEHHVFFVLTKVGIPIKLENDEAFTYYSGMVLSKILPIINKNNGTRTKSKNTKRVRK